MNDSGPRPKIDQSNCRIYLAAEQIEARFPIFSKQTKPGLAPLCTKFSSNNSNLSAKERSSHWIVSIMSARPRPVTATFIPRSLAPPTGVRTRSYSLSSGASTESLVSVLDHDSYESPGDDSDTESPKKTNNQRTEKIKHVRPRKPHHLSQNTVNSINSSPNKHSTLDSWEDWMIKKAKDMRIKQQQEIQQEKKVHEGQKRKEEERNTKHQQGQEKIKEWVENKNHQEKLRRNVKSRQEHSKQEVEAVKKQETQHKAHMNYDKWQVDLKKKESERRKNEKEKKKKAQLEKEEKESKSKEAYDQWLTKAKTRPKSVHNSLGYTSGKLTGYYDTSAYPMPTFYNPMPWHPVEIPKEKPLKKRSKSATRWNPNKYF